MKKRAIFCILIAVFAVAIFGCSPRIPSKDYTVSFDSAGGTLISDKILDVIEECPIPQKDGYVFEGWYKSGDFSSKVVDFPYVPTESITLYAKYIDLKVGNEEIEYFRREGGFIAASYSGESSSVVVPATYRGENVVGIKSGFLRNFTQIKKIYLGKNIKNIEENFYNCRHLDEFILIEKSDFFAVEDGILYNADMTEIFSFPRAKTVDETFVLPDTVTTVKRNAFRNVNSIKVLDLNNTSDFQESLSHIPELERVEAKGTYMSRDGILYDRTGKILLACPIKYGVICILDADTEVVVGGAFKGCEIEQLVLNSELTDFGTQEDMECLKSVAVIGNSRYYSRGGVLYDRKNNELILYPAASTEEEFCVKNVEAIGSNAFGYAKNLTKLTIGAEVKKISAFAFERSVISEIIFEEDSELTEISSSAFVDGNRLKTVLLTSSVPPVFEAAETVPFDFYVPDDSYGDYIKAWQVQYLHIKRISSRF